MNYKRVWSCSYSASNNLLFSFLIITSSDLVVLKLVGVLRLGNNTQVVTQLLLLEVSLGEVLQLTLGETKVLGTGNSDLSAVTGDNNSALGEVAGLSISNLDTLVEVLLE